MKCTNCGFDAENNSKCPVCGFQLKPENPQPTQVQPPAGAPYQTPPVSADNLPQVPKKKSKAGIIVLICVIGIVIIAGILLAVFSRSLIKFTPFSQDNSPTEVIIEDDAEVSDETVPGSVIPEENVVYTVEKIDMSKCEIHKIGEYIDLGNAGSVKVASVKKTSGDSSAPEEYANYELTLEFKNTTGEKINFADFELAFFDKDGNNLEPSGEAAKNAKPLVIINDPYNKYKIYADKNPGETDTRVVKFSAINKAENAYFALKKHGFRSSENNVTAVIEIDINNIK